MKIGAMKNNIPAALYICLEPERRSVLQAGRVECSMIGCMIRLKGNKDTLKPAAESREIKKQGGQTDEKNAYRSSCRNNAADC